MFQHTSVYVLDGGMGHEIRKRNLPFRRPQWSALVLRQKPQALIDIHSDFIKEGAQIITTNTYAIAPFHITDEIFLRDAPELIKIAIECAIAARDKHSEKNVKIAFSIPPLFGSYRPDYFEANRKTNAPEYYKLFLDSAEPFLKDIDFYLIETMSSIAEAKFMCELMQQRNKDYMIAFALDEETQNLRIGQLQEIGLIIKAQQHKPLAAMINCTQPEKISRNLHRLEKNLPEGVRLGAYANNFKQLSKEEQYNNQTVRSFRDDLSMQEFQAICEDYIKKGSSIVGGCCGIGPEYMQSIEQAFKNQKMK